VLIPDILALAAVLWAVWRPLRAAFSRRFALAYPSLTGKLRLAILLMAALLLIIFRFVPEMGWVVVTIALVTVVVERWRAQPNWGQKRGLPPGSLRLFPPTWRNDRFYLEQAREYGPMFKTSSFIRPTVCVVGLETGIRLLRENEERLESPFLPFSVFVPGGMLRYMREPQHRHYRTIFRGVLAPRVIAGFQSVFTARIASALGRMCSENSSGQVEFQPGEYLHQLMLDLWLQLFFAIEPGSAAAKRMLELYPVIDITNPTKASARRIRKAVNEVANQVNGELSGWREQGQAPPCLLSVIADENPQNADDPVVIGNLIYMLSTTAADMSALLNWIVRKACEHPDWMERIAAENPALDGAGSPSLADRFVMETLRMRQSEFIYRAVIRDIDFDGFQIPKGWLLRICVWESHRDPVIFPEPDRFNPDRFLGRSYARNEYSPFGAASHACIAPFLVNSVAGQFVRQLASGYRVSSPTDGSVVLASSRHWAPGPRFRVNLSPRTRSAVQIETFSPDVIE